MANNLLSNLLVVAIVTWIGIIIYCQVKRITFWEFIAQMRESMSGAEEGT